MKQRKHLLQIFIALTVLSAILYACSKGGDGGGGTPNPCAGKTITVTATSTNADAGASNGTITATATGSSNFTYSINGGAFQASGTFGSLAKGNYTVTAKDAAGCIGSQTFTVNETDVCAGKTITVTGAGTASDPCAPGGTITITATGSTGFTYNIDGGAFQASNVFNAVTAGNHNIGAKDVAGCVKTGTATVTTAAAGPLFGAVKTLINSKCTGCHSGGAAASGGIDFTVDCNIVLKWDRIKARAVDAAGTANQMPQPPNPALSAADQQKITDWITAGHLFTN